jgi:hypothetical protein
MAAFDDHASTIAGVDVSSCLSNRYIAHEANNVRCLKLSYAFGPKQREDVSFDPTSIDIKSRRLLRSTAFA